MKIKFITLNIWEGGKLFDFVTSFIKKENPDIIAMQEVTNGRDLKLENLKISVFNAHGPWGLDGHDSERRLSWNYRNLPRRNHFRTHHLMHRS